MPVYRCNIVADLRSNVQENVLHYNYIGPEPGGPNVAQAQQLAEAIRDDLVPAYQTLVSVGVTFTEVQVRSLDDDTVGADLSLGNVAGTRAGDNYAPQVCPIVRFKTAKVGRSYQGGVKSFTAVEADYDGGGLNPAYITDLTTFWNAALALNLAAITIGELMVYSRTLNESNPVTQVLVRPGTGRSASRQLGRGI